MKDGYDCHQNALAERINGILINEYLPHKPQDLEDARKICKALINKASGF
tara:strand:- start:2124 stop:2273 length:150 start_codon:yes stop_codon:yes gene_type:complete